MSVTVQEVTGQVAAAVADAVEHRGGQWAAPFTAAGRRLPHNPVAGHAYTGVNWLLLSLAAASRGYSSGGWATSSQWQQAGCRVRRGERSIYAVRVDAFGGAGSPALPSASSYPLFHVSQVDGKPPPSDRFARPQGITHRAVTAAFRQTGAPWIVQDAAAAHYDPAAGRIVTPPADMYLTPDLWASAVAHEHAHWTADSPGGRRPAPGCEELTVELAAAAVCNSLGLSYTPSGAHAARLRECVPPLRSGHGPAALAVSAAVAQSTAAFLVEAIEHGVVEQAAPAARPNREKDGLGLIAASNSPVKSNLEGLFLRNPADSPVSDGNPLRPPPAPPGRPETDISLEEARSAVAAWLLTEAARAEDLDPEEAADQVSTLLDCPAFPPPHPAARPSERVRRRVGVWLMGRAEEAGLAAPGEAAAVYADLLGVPEAALASPRQQTDERSSYGLS